MKYTITHLDGRYSYREYFACFIGFSTHMANQRGPLEFNNCLVWFIDTYGWSAEIHQYDQLNKWYLASRQVSGLSLHRPATSVLLEPSLHCNPQWSWSHRHGDLRIYLASDKELTFFQLTHPVDQKTQ